MHVGVFVCVYVCLYGPSPHGEVIRRRLSGTSTLFICTVFVLLLSDTAEGFSYAFLFFVLLSFTVPHFLFFFSPRTLFFMLLPAMQRAFTFVIFFFKPI